MIFLPITIDFQLHVLPQINTRSAKPGGHGSPRLRKMSFHQTAKMVDLLHYPPQIFAPSVRPETHDLEKLTRPSGAWGRGGNAEYF